MSLVVAAIVVWLSLLLLFMLLLALAAARRTRARERRRGMPHASSDRRDLAGSEPASVVRTLNDWR